MHKIQFMFPQKTLCVSKIKWLMLFRKIITVFSPNHTISKTLTSILLKQSMHITTNMFQTVSVHSRCRFIFRLFGYCLLPSLSEGDRQKSLHKSQNFCQYFPSFWQHWTVTQLFFYKECKLLTTCLKIEKSKNKYWLVVYLFTLSLFSNHFQSEVVHYGQYAAAIIVFTCF